MCEELYMSRNKDDNKTIELWVNRPKWTIWFPGYVGCCVLGPCDIKLGDQAIMTINAHSIPQLEPGQLAKVNRVEEDGVVTLRLGEIIESH